VLSGWEREVGSSGGEAGSSVARPHGDTGEVLRWCGAQGCGDAVTEGENSHRWQIDSHEGRRWQQGEPSHHAIPLGT
jgi:hypothetical protein